VELQGRTKLDCCSPVVAEVAVVALDIAAAGAADSDTAVVAASVRAKASQSLLGEKGHPEREFVEVVVAVVVAAAVVDVAVAVAAGTDRPWVREAYAAVPGAGVDGTEVHSVAADIAAEETVPA